MTPPPSPDLVVGSVSSTYSIRDAIDSYRRSQLMLSTSGVLSSSYTGFAIPTDDEESRLADEDEDDLLTPRPEDFTRDGFVSGLAWDMAAAPAHPTLPRVEAVGENRSGEQLTAPRGPAKVNERSPLLPRPQSSSEEPVSSAALRRLSNAAPTKPAVAGQSTFSQTFFNATGLLLGIGMLSEPLAFSYAGWICGTLLIILYGYITCYTAKFLAGVVSADPRIRSYADIGQKAFGARSMPFVNSMFCFETFSIGVILVTVYADSLNALVPAFSSDAYKILGLFILIPTVFLPPSLLSYGSLLGILSTVSLIAVVFIDGLTKLEAPGSLWQPAETSFSTENLEELGLAFGLFMAGFGAHAALPSLARDMAEPHRFNKAMNYSFSFATAVYAIIGMAGYLMFGNDVDDEVSQNLLRIPGYNPVLNKIALWMLVVAPLTKYALGTRPLNITLEVQLGLDNHLPEEASFDQKSSPAARGFNRSLKRILIVCERVALVCLSVTVSILVPDFGSIMAILGSFTVFVMCVLGPVAAKMCLEKRMPIHDVTIFTTALVMAAWGTAAAFWSTTQ